MSELLRPISVVVPNSKRVLSFGRSQDVRKWIDKEIEYWTEHDAKEIQDRHLRNYWQVQINFVNSVSHACLQVEKISEATTNEERDRSHATLDQTFNQLRNGEVMCKDSANFPHVADLWKSSPDAAALILTSSRNDAGSLLGAFGQNFRFSSLISTILSSRLKGSDAWLQPQRDELAELKGQLEQVRDEVSTKATSFGGIIASHSDAESKAVLDRNKDWHEKINEVSRDWDRLIKTYDEAMAMAAPSTYWNGRATTHKNQAVGFGAAFGLVLVTGLIVFVLAGLPYLSGQAGIVGKSVVLTLVPVLLPAFGFVWVLRMLGRLLGESLHMMRDAKERETMVKTFLAFVHDEERGRSLLLEQDRILILHALFRPSSVNSVDDSPPVHWFDILSSKMGDRAKP